MPSLPDPHGLFALGLTVAAFYLFSRERVPLEISSLLILVALCVVFYVFPYAGAGGRLRPADFLSGFGHEALITITALMIAGKGLETTGALQPLVALMSRRWSRHPTLSMLITLIACGVLSAFLNNTPIVVMLLPVLVSVSLRSRQPASRVLMPMGFATLVGGMGTSIGTSTNLLVVGVARDLGQQHIGMFDFTVPVAIAGGFGVLYLWLVAPRLLPPRAIPLADSSPRLFDAVLYVNEGSFAAGRPLSEVLQKTDNSMKITRIQRGDNLFLVRLPTLELRKGDRLYISDSPENIKEYERTLGATLYDVADIEHPVSEEHPLQASGQQLAEVVVTEGSPLHNRSLRQARFAERYHLVTLAIHRSNTHTSAAERDLSDVVLQAGDVLLMQGAQEHIADLKRSGRMLVLDATVDLPRTKKAPVALMIMAAVVLAAATGLLPISVSALGGVALMLGSRCLTLQDAGRAVNGAVILLIAASLALGLALTRTGGADFIAHVFVALASGFPPTVIMSGLMLLLAFLTNVVSNNAAAVIGTPIAVSMAQQLGVPSEAFVLAVLFGANMSYATPVGYQTNLLIYTTGGYRFSDFMRVGIPLTAIMWIAFTVLLPMFYPI